MSARVLRLACFAALLGTILVTHRAWAQARRTDGTPATNKATAASSYDENAEAVLGGVPRLRPPPSLSELAGRRLSRIEVVTEGGRWHSPTVLRYVRVGEVLSFGLARRAMRELTDSGRYANVRAEALADGDGAILRLTVLPRRIIASVKLSSGTLDSTDTLRAAGVRESGELTARDLPQIAERVRTHYRRRGFPEAQVGVGSLDTDDPMRVVLLIEVAAGSPLRIQKRWFGVWPDPKVSGLEDVLATYEVEPGDRVDDEVLVTADRNLENTLRARGWHRAQVLHRVDRARSGTRAILHVLVRAGPRMLLRFEGNRHFDAAELEAALALDESEDRAPATLVERIRDFYVKRGFLDVELNVDERGLPSASIHELAFLIREQFPVRVSLREYPCLSGERTASDVGSEIDSFLSEELPGGGILDAVDPRGVDATLGPTGTTGARPVPYRLNPWKMYVPDVYERAMKHVQDLYRSEGYLSASVGPVELLRRHCQLRSPAGRCLPAGPRRRPLTLCRFDEIGLPLDELPVSSSLGCVPDPTKGLRCEPEVMLHMPIKLGPRTYLYDVAFQGNRALIEADLEEIAELELGTPVSQVELDKARRRVLDAYAEEGFAFADVETDLELSPDHTRGLVRFVISEREHVHVSKILIRGARNTSESLIRSRVALEVGGPYRRSLVRKTEERIATLGVFSTITVGFEDPYVPARQKVVVITVVERRPQYLDVRPGFSTGEGFRITFEYGHRNLLGEAIQLTLRSQLGYLPDGFIIERDVRRKYEKLETGERLERRNSATIEFPEIGLGPLFRLSVEGVDVRDNARDFGLTKDAGIVTLIYRPERTFSVQLGASVELNDATIFDEETPLAQYIEDNPRHRSTFRIPAGTSLAIAQRIGFTWDRRDNPLGATNGTLLSAGVEHVHACPPSGCPEPEQARQTPSPFDPALSEFLRWTNRIAGYVRFSDKGLALAASFRWGYNQQLDPENSRTYPDRLFFLGGVDSIRGYLQDSLVPQDIAEELLNPNPPAGEQPLTLRQVVIRGGDVFVNPRLELRIPLSGDVQTALFIDAGNLWTDPGKVALTKLRYAAGTGLRIATPIGPLVFDYGFNIDRVLDEFYPSRDEKRFWEDIGAFHFSIGLF